jgi:hypothetical protein
MKVPTIRVVRASVDHRGLRVLDGRHLLVDLTTST